jgi:hypothetical protein
MTVAETLSTVPELVAEGDNLDVTWLYNQWRDQLAALMGKVTDRFELHKDPSTEGRGLTGEMGSGIHGDIQCFVGPDIDWLVYSWMADPEHGFANMHLTISPAAHVDVPLFGMAFAVFGPYPWAYIDYGQRRDQSVDREYHYKYFDVLNENWLQVRRNNQDLRWFTSPTSYIRAVTSPIAFCYSGPMEQPTIDIIKDQAHLYLDTWLGFWDNPGIVPVEEREAMQQYTVDWRRTVAELDPANVMGERLFGKEITDNLVSTLWGDGRQIPSPMKKD